MKLWTENGNSTLRKSTSQLLKLSFSPTKISTASPSYPGVPTMGCYLSQNTTPVHLVSRISFLDMLFSTPLVQVFWMYSGSPCFTSACHISSWSPFYFLTVRVSASLEVTSLLSSGIYLTWVTSVWFSYLPTSYIQTLFYVHIRHPIPSRNPKHTPERQ